MTTSYPRFTPHERRKLTMSTRARESFRAVGIRGGAGPGEGAPAPSQGYYALSEDDRALIEGVIADTHSDDLVRRKAALTWWSNAIKDIPDVGPLTVAQLFTGQSFGSLILDLLGSWVIQPFTVPSGACSTDTGGTQAVVSGLSVSAPFEVNGTTYVDVSISAIFHIYDWNCDPAFFSAEYNSMWTRYRNIQAFAQVAATGGAVPDSGGNARVFGGGNFDRAGDWHDDCAWPGYSVVDLYGLTRWEPTDSMTRRYVAGAVNCFSVSVGSLLPGTPCSSLSVCAGGDYSWGPEMGAPEMAGAPPPGPPTVPVDPCDLVDRLRDYPYAPPPGTPPGTPPGGLPPGGNPVDPGTGLPPGELPSQPPDPGTNPFPGQPPTDVPTDGECFIDATTISPEAVDALTSGIEGAWTARTNDSAERLYAPQGSDGCRDFDPVDEAYLITPLVTEGWSNDNGHVCPPASWCASAAPPDVPPGVPTPPAVPPGPVAPTGPGAAPIDSGIQDPAAGGCMTLASEPAGFRDPKQAGGIARQYQPGQPMVIDYGAGSKCQTKIVKVTPNTGTDGGPQICVGGGIDSGGKTTDKTCYGPGPVTDAIQSVLGEMIAEGGSIIFDSDCTRELHRPLCFRAGTSKRVILNKLLDMCGFCVFPMFDCNVIVGYCGPVNVVWTYHEDVDLIKFDLEYDGQQVYDYVEVFRGDFISRAGNVFVPGNSVLYPVGSPASSPNGDRIYQYEVSYGTPDSELNSIAVTLAAKLRSQALPEIAFGVPLNSQLALRHQLRIQMPSVGFDAYYMVTRLVRDYDRENGHLSTGQARWLHAT